MEEQQRTEELLQGQLELWHHALGYIKSMALKCALDVGIPDAIARCDGAATLPDLLAATGLPPCNLSYVRRLMRVLTISGIFQQQQKQPASSGEGQQEAVYALTPASRLLVSEDGNGQGAPSFGQIPAMSLPLCRTFMTPFLGMHPWIADERAAATSLFEREHGQALWEMTRSTSINDEFNQCMTADTRLIMHAVLTLSPDVFEGVTSLVDVGGANGTAAAAIARAFPHINCTVLDLPHVIENAPAPDEAAGGNTVRFVAGDMFHHIPPAHAVLLKWILHDWNDDECIKILRQCKKAIPIRDGGGKVIIIDSVVGSNPCDNICNETQALFDLYIMFINGAEREEREWKRIFVEAGFSDYKIMPILGFRSIIELYP